MPREHICKVSDAPLRKNGRKCPKDAKIEEDYWLNALPVLLHIPITSCGNTAQNSALMRYATKSSPSIPYTQPAALQPFPAFHPGLIQLLPALRLTR